MLKKPETCLGCPLHTKGVGFAPAYGPKESKLLVVGEALGENEARQGQAFVGPSGNILNRGLRHAGVDRKKIRLHNIISCQPPNNWLVGAPWEYEAIEHCSVHLNETFNTGNQQVILACGATAAKALLGLTAERGVSIYDLHGAPALDKTGRFWVVPTFHPSHILNGNWNLYGVFVFDIARAYELAIKGHKSDEAKLIMDPGYWEFANWAKELIRLAEISENGIWLAVDIETPKKQKSGEEDETLGESDIDTIHRINFSYTENEAITVPFDEQHLEWITKILAHPKIKKCFWNMVFDVGNLEAAGVPVEEPKYDFMYGFHVLQSDIKMSLGFVAPFYSTYGPWKHLTDHNVSLSKLSQEQVDKYKVYSAVDGIQTIRCVNGIEKELKQMGAWDIFERHIRDVDRFCFRPAEKIGLPIDKEKLEDFKDYLLAKETEALAICHQHDPGNIAPLAPIWKTPKPAMDSQGNLKHDCVEVTETTMCYVCKNCGKINVNKAHTKTKACNGAELVFQEHTITYWGKKNLFNPNSPKQVLDYIKSQGHKPGKKKKAKKKPKKGSDESSDVQALERLARQHPENKMYPAILEMRKISKMKGTYCEGMLERMDENNRVHTTFTHIPATLRSSSKNPNLQNLVSKDKREDEDGYGQKFRACVVPSPGCFLLEADYGGIEAVETGWFAKDKDYIRLAKLSVHAYLTSHLVKKPIDLNLSNEDLKAALDEIKKDHYIEYNKAKRVVHGSAYGLSARGLHLTYPEVFPDIKSAKDVQNLFFAVAAKVHNWQKSIVKKADQQGYLGGSDHPFNYRHWFWNVLNYSRVDEREARRLKAVGQQVAKGKDGTLYHVTPGADSKRCIAFYPQSTAGAVLKEDMLTLFNPDSDDFIGDLYYGQTPLRAPIHDAILLEVPKANLDKAIETVARVMRSPIKQQPLDPDWGMGDYLTMDISLEVGKDWANMNKVKI